VSSVRRGSRRPSSLDVEAQSTRRVSGFAWMYLHVLTIAAGTGLWSSENILFANSNDITDFSTGRRLISVIVRSSLFPTKIGYPECCEADGTDEGN